MTDLKISGADVSRGAIGDTIPVLDLGPYLAGEPGSLDAVAAELRRACENVGFFFISNHGVPQALIDNVFEAARRFHALPMNEKMPLKANEHNIGYMPFKTSVSRASAIYTAHKPNLVSAFFLKRDLPDDHPDVLANKRFRGVNRWPALPGFRETTVAYMSALEALAKRMLPLYATALELPPNWFEKAFAEPQYTLRLSHYPKPDQVEDEQFGLAPHTDSSFMTLLAQNRVQGLQIRKRSGEWIDAPAIPGTFVVNSGDMLYRWTNERFLSTPHRAINRSDGDRYAIPFFFDAQIDYPMTCIETCRRPNEAPKYPPTSYMEYMLWFTGRNYDHMRKDPPVAAE